MPISDPLASTTTKPYFRDNLLFSLWRIYRACQGLMISPTAFPVSPRVPNCRVEVPVEVAFLTIANSREVFPPFLKGLYFPDCSWITNGCSAHTRSHLDPAALNPVVEQEPNQVGHTHIPHGCTGGDEENEEVLFVESDVPDDQGKLNPGKEEDDSQDRTRKDLKARESLNRSRRVLSGERSHPE